MVKSIVLILLLFNGDLVLKEVKFDGTLMECLAYGDTLREKLSEYEEFGLTGKASDQGWYLQNFQHRYVATFQGYFCKDNYEDGITIKRKAQ